MSLQSHPFVSFIMCRWRRWRRTVTACGRWCQQQQLELQIRRGAGLLPPPAPEARRDPSRGLHHPRVPSHHLHPPWRRPRRRQRRVHKLRQEGRGQEEEKEEERQEGQEGEREGWWVEAEGWLKNRANLLTSQSQSKANKKEKIKAKCTL